MGALGYTRIMIKGPAYPYTTVLYDLEQLKIIVNSIRY